MTDKPGHFEQGRWIVDSAPPAPQPVQPGADAIDKRLSDATRAVRSSVDTMMNVTRDLITTGEGKQYIEKTVQDTQKDLQRSFDEIISRIKAGLDKNVKR
jgi:heme oxygenase